MPQGNRGVIGPIADGADTVLSMRTLASAANPVGAFVGGGVGNKAITGFSGFNGMKLSELGGLEFDAKILVGPTTNIYFNFLVDLDCSADENLGLLKLADITARRRIVVWNPNIASGYAVGGGYTRYAGSFADSQWNIVGAPALGMSPLGNPSAALTPLSGYPFACVVDGVSGDNGLPRNLAQPACVTAAALNPATDAANCGAPTQGAMLILGDTANLIAREILVKRVRVRDRVITFAP